MPQFFIILVTIVISKLQFSNIMFPFRMADKADEAVEIISKIIAEHKECTKTISELTSQLTKSKTKADEIEKKIESSLQKALQSEKSEFQRKLNEQEETYTNKIRALVQKSIEIREENERLKARIQLHSNETMQITILEQHNNLLTERVALIEGSLRESERAKQILENRMGESERGRSILEDRLGESERAKQILENRIISLENENKSLAERILRLENEA